MSLALDRPADARTRDIVALQRLAGNQAVVQLATPATGSAAAEPETEVNPPPGPYTGRRRRNDKMDTFEDQMYLFGPDIFRHYGPYWELWAPLAGLIGKYFIVNVTTEAGIALDTTDRRLAAWVIIERFNPKKAAHIRQEKAGWKRNRALMDAIWGEFGEQYSFAKRVCDREWRQSNFLLPHEWLAVRFGSVQPPYAYWAKRKTRP